MNEKFTLNDIADWQLVPELSKVELPIIQRGFVWKAKQVEELWDSILREYPIGSFLLSETIKETFYLLDGQQRATSIFLGFFNPFSPQSTAKSWAIKGELPVVWIDVYPKENYTPRKYLIRLTTISHPWGYQAGNNGSILSISDRKKALEIFKKNPDNVNGYTSFKNTTIFPYDANCPLPLCFFLESESIDQVIDKVRIYLPNYFSTKYGEFDNKNEFIKLLQNVDFQNKIEDILTAVKGAKQRTVNFDIVSNKALHEEEQSDNPTLFIRINSSGTPLSGDELIYSIYKATFPETKNLVEKIGMNFIPPTQVISMVSRIVWAKMNNDCYPAKMNVGQFQERVKIPEFRDLMQVLINQQIKNTFEKAITILQCKDNQMLKGVVPPVIVKQFVNKSSELFLFFIYWLNKFCNEIDIDDNLQMKMVTKLYVFSWFEFRNIPLLWQEEISEKTFWKKTLNKHIWWRGIDGIHFLLPPALIRSYYQQNSIEKMFIENSEHRWGLLEEGVGQSILSYYNRVKSQEFELNKANEYFWQFINVIQHCKQLILFAQRDYINDTFGDYNQIDNIEDTNVPWDWDHIYPSEWVYNQKHCNKAIRDWNNTNGNLRALSLEQNRSESNKISPKDKFSINEIRVNSFVKNSDWNYWQKIDNRIYGNEVQDHFHAITERMINIYEKIWTELRIEKLIDSQ